GFFSIVAYYTNNNSTLRDLPITLPQLIGSYTSKRIAKVVIETLNIFSINYKALSYYILNNIYTNNRAIISLA
ncbi:hypothetical protein BKA66DRAFT_434505, partial [Pyrenochaeta sp. MPI-SDFR-AT-0127]